MSGTGHSLEERTILLHFCRFTAHVAYHRRRLLDCYSRNSSIGRIAVNNNLHCVSKKFPPWNSLFLPYMLNICGKFEFLISQGSVEACLRWDGYCCMGFVANFVRFPAVQIFWKSVKTWQSYREFQGGDFFETQCSIRMSHPQLV